MALAEILRPKLIRLLAAQTSKRAEIGDSFTYLTQNHPWLIPLYAEAVDRVHDAGFKATVENEVGNCIFSSVAEIRAFFNALNRRGEVCLTWDVQNLWQMGVFPSMAAYCELKDLIGYYHLKGGQHDGQSQMVRWRSALADASWPVVEITQQVVADGVSPVMCLNPSHGTLKPGYDYSAIVERDLDFLRRHVFGRQFDVTHPGLRPPLRRRGI